MSSVHPLHRLLRFGSFAALLPRVIAGFGLLLSAGCATTGDSPSALPPGASAVPPISDSVTIREGDVVRVSFPGARELDTSQTVRRDGRITLPIVGEVKATGLAPAELEKQLVELYAPQLVSKEVSVTLVSSNFIVFVTGAVRQPGKIQTDRPLTALEAVMEAGGFDFAKANTRAVVVVRRENNKMTRYTVDLKQALDGTSAEPFFLKPSDIVYVPEKFSWF